MLSVALLGKELIIRAADEPRILQGGYRIFFTTIGFSVLGQNLSIELAHKSQLQILDLIEEVTTYLRDEGFEFNADKDVIEILTKRATSRRDFDTAKHDGEIAKSIHQIAISPPTMIRKLRDFQTLALNHLLEVQHGANFSVPGSGKTTVIYAAYDILKQTGLVERLIMVGPRSSFQPWEEEYEECFGTRPNVKRLIGTKDQRSNIYKSAAKFEIFLCTYQTAANDINELIRICQRYKTFVVLDESHNVKRLEGGVWADSVLELAPYATRRAVLSGTPAPNDVLDLWTQITFLWPEKYVLDEKLAFRSRADSANAQDYVQNAIRPFFFRVKKSDLHLPKPVFEKHQLELNQYQASIYHALSVRFLSELDLGPEDRAELRTWRRAKMVRLIQTTSNPSLLVRYSDEFRVPPLSADGTSLPGLIERYSEFETPIKISYVADLVRELASRGEKVVVWSWFVHNLVMLESILNELSPLMVYGAIPRDASENDELNRESEIHRFKSDPSYPVLLANPTACSESISLHTAARHAIYLDRTFNCGQYLQSLDRIHRIGLPPDAQVVYHIPICINTIDETIDRRLAEKEERMLAILESDDVQIGDMEEEPGEIAKNEVEEERDFDETIDDLRRHVDSWSGPEN